MLQRFLQVSCFLAAFLCSSFAWAEAYVCPEDIGAFDPSSPGKLIGQFNRGTKLEIGKVSSTPGMYQVTYLGPDGKFVMALCRAEDLGKAPKTSSSSSILPKATAAVSAFASSAVFKTIQSDLVDADGRNASPTKLAQSKYVLIYFSAHWCPPCCKFTPELVSFYNQNKDKNLEVVFASSDNSAADMSRYMKELSMPWVGVRFGSQANGYLQSTFCGPGIPCLVLLDENGNVLSNSYVNGNYVGPHKVLNDLKQKL